MLAGPLDRIGVWTVERSLSAEVPSSGSTGTVSYEPMASLAVNLASVEETDLRPDPRLLEQAPASYALGSWLTRPIWIYLTLLACGLAVVEWWLYQRRILG